MIELANWVAFESQCCGFLDFELSVTSQPAETVLTVRGDEAAMRFVDRAMGDESAATHSDREAAAGTSLRRRLWPGLSAVGAGLLAALCCFPPVFTALGLAGLGAAAVAFDFIAVGLIALGAVLIGVALRARARGAQIKRVGPARECLQPTA